MRTGTRLGFLVPSSGIRNGIYTPRYYDPSIEARLTELSGTHDLVALQDLIDSGELRLRQGKYIDKMHYGSGEVPYVRTSDIANWELRANPKHGVSESVANEYRAWMDVREMDVLLVHEGTYLIGTPCLITRHDTEILFQHHLAKMRAHGARMSGPLLMASLLAPVVQRQIRARQFTADVIDSIVGRLPEVKIPLHKSAERRESIAREAAEVFDGRAAARARLALLLRGLDVAVASGTCRELVEQTFAALGNGSGHVGFLGVKDPSESFTVRAGALRNDVLVPRYYDPLADSELRKMSSTCDLTTVGELMRSGVIDVETGDEVGKLEYGGGEVSFIRTSDFGNWELKHDPKQRVSQDVYAAYANRQSAAVDDILLVRDGTYLVGTTTIVEQDDLPLLYSGGIYRIRVVQRDRLAPALLLALLNMRVVQRQVRNKQFTRDVIDTLGHRLEEVVLPVPASAEDREAIGGAVESLLRERALLRHQAARLGDAVEAR